MYQSVLIGLLMAKATTKHPFDRKDGILIIPLTMLKSKNYQTLYPYAQRLMILMQVHWREDRPVAFGVGEAMSLLHCEKRTAMKAFKELQERGFIVKVGESLFNSRTKSKARTWRLTWMPYNWHEPTKEWKEWSS